MTDTAYSTAEEVLPDVLAAEHSAELSETDEPPGPDGHVPEEEADPDAEGHVHHPDDDAFIPPGDPTEEAGTDLVRVATLLDVPLHYERKHPPGPASFFVSRSFVAVLEQTLRQLQQRVPDSYGRLQRISSAGMFVNKSGMHGRGHACDWDRLVFERVQIAPLARDHTSSSGATRRRYWGFTALCRANSAFVLHGEYDDGPHDDHVHQDTGGAFAFDPGSRATVTLIQAMLNEIHGHSPRLRVDGQFGDATGAALDQALSRIGLSGTVHDVVTFRRFLRRSARLAFHLSPVR